MDTQILRACKELVDDAKACGVDLVFKETCLTILSRAHNILPKEQFEQLAEYASKRMKEKTTFEIAQPRLTIQT
ncbi:MAG: hypothetical protein ACE14S_11540 [Candidatus Bathyarchaeia archaeon]